MVTKYKRYVICGTCGGLGKVEEEFTKEDKPEVKKESEVEKDAKDGQK